MQHRAVTKEEMVAKADLNAAMAEIFVERTFKENNCFNIDNTVFFVTPIKVLGNIVSHKTVAEIR